jgi:pantoate--beta-alanine ligase
MLIFQTVLDLQKHIRSEKRKGKKIGFAPTMGALHEGHLELIRLAQKDCDVTVCSIFVNPTQFNDPKDLEKYPRTVEKDSAMLASGGCNILFLPSVAEIYPPDVDLRNRYDFKQLTQVMEGAFRPGHFDGMAQVVKRLVDIVKPNALYMGQKDFQQFSIVKNMLKQMRSRTRLVRCATVREADGLAMSSRNVRLTPENRAAAPKIYATLCWIKENLEKIPLRTLETEATARLNAIPDFKVEYVGIVDAITLLPVEKPSDTKNMVVCTALWAGNVRLIDNVVLKE